MSAIIYPIGHRVRWSDANAKPRNGAQTGVLSREWREYSAASVLWDGEVTPHPEYPECIEVCSLTNELEQKPATRTVGNRNAWDEYKPAGRRVRA